jgi:hypothetical protein
LLIALGITIIVSVVEGGIQMEDTSEILAITIYGFPMEQFAGSHDCGNFSGSDGNIVKCEWRRSFSDVDYRISEGKKWLSKHN